MLGGDSRICCFMSVCFFLTISVHGCARTKSSTGNSGLPAPGITRPGATTPATVDETTAKSCPALDTFSPQPETDFQLISPETPVASGDSTTASCPATGTSLLVPDGTGAKPAPAELSCSSSTGVWSFADGSPFDPATTPVACGAKCAACSVASPITTANDLYTPDTSTPVSACDAPTVTCKAGDTTVGITQNGARFDGVAAVAPFTCVGGKFVDANMGIFDEIRCADHTLSDAGNACIFEEASAVECAYFSKQDCVNPTSMTSVPYTGSNAFLFGEYTAVFECPPDMPLLFIFSNNFNNGHAQYFTIPLPLSADDESFSCIGGEMRYYGNGVTQQDVNNFGCVANPVSQLS